MKNNVTNALNVLYAKNENIYPVSVSKYNSARRTSYFFNDSKQRMVLYFSNKNIVIIEGNNVKTQW